MRIDMRVTLLAATMLLMISGCIHRRDPLQDWLKAGDSASYRTPSPAESAMLAKAFAQALHGEGAHGWEPLGHEMLVADDEHAVREAAPRTRGWGAYVFRTGAARALVVQAPHSESDRRTGEIAFDLYRAVRARALALNSAHRSLDGADQANAVDVPFALLGREAGRSAVDALVVQVHGYGAATARRHGLGARSVVLSNGTRAPDPALRVLAGCLAQAGFDTRLFPTEASYPGGTRNAVRAAMADSGAGRFVHLELGEALRRDLVRDADHLQSFAACL